MGLQRRDTRRVFRLHQKTLPLGLLSFIKGGCDCQEQQTLGIAREAMPWEPRVGG